MTEPVPRFDGLHHWRGLGHADREIIGALALELVAAWHAYDALGPEGPKPAEPACARAARAGNRRHRRHVHGQGREPACAPAARAGNAVLQRAAQTADLLLMTQLQDFATAVLEPARLRAADGRPRIPSLLGDVCRHCGCSHRDPCTGGCSWVAPGVCSACAPFAAIRAAAAEAVAEDLDAELGRRA